MKNRPDLRGGFVLLCVDVRRCLIWQPLRAIRYQQACGDRVSISFHWAAKAFCELRDSA